MSDWLKPDQPPLGLPHPNSPASKMYDWSSAGVPHPNSPAGRISGWPPAGIPHPNSPAGQNSTIVPNMTMRQRFMEVLKLAPNHMGPELAAQFRAMLTPASLAMIAGTFAALAISQAFGVGEIVDLILLVIGVIFVGMAVFTAAKDIYECVKTTARAKTTADLDRAADYLAQAVAILGVVAFFAFVAKVGEKFGGAASAEEGSAGASGEVEAPPKPQAKPKAEERPISEQSTAKKGIFGEYHADRYMEDNGYQKLNGDPVQLGDSPKGPGIDGVYQNSSPPPQYVIGEAKYGSSQLGMTEDGKQMSPEWVDNRLDDSVGEETADQIRRADANGQVERWVLRVDENGNVTKTVLK